MFIFTFYLLLYTVWIPLTHSVTPSPLPLINIHVVPHSHVDPMWLFTSKEYSKRCEIILEKMIITLLLDEKKTFVWESIFFLDDFLTKYGTRSICSHLSVSSQSEKKMKSNDMIILKTKYQCMSYKDSLVLLLDRHQVELVGGGWVAVDEALTDASSALMNMAVGRSWIAENLGKRFLPTSSWSIDSFGHSAGTSSLLVGLGYTNQVLNRIPYDLKAQFQGQVNPFVSWREVLTSGWNARSSINTSRRNNVFHFETSRESERFKFSESSTNIVSGDVSAGRSSLLTTVLPGHYSMPCDVFAHCSYLFEETLNRGEIREIAMSLLKHVSQHASKVVLNPSGDGMRKDSKVGHFLLLIGDDFSARKADIMYENIDLVLKEFDTISKHNDHLLPEVSYMFAAQYSTPQRYFGAYSSIYNFVNSRKEPSNATATKLAMRNHRGHVQKHLRVNNATFHANSVASSVEIASGDLLPYSDNIVNDWTGFYGSRPSLKLKIRDLEMKVRLLDLYIIGVLANSRVELPVAVVESWLEDLLALKRTVALAYHHDTITGTSRHFVVNSFIADLQSAHETYFSIVTNLLIPNAQRDINHHSIRKPFINLCNGFNFMEETLNVNPTDVMFFVNMDFVYQTLHKKSYFPDFLYHIKTNDASNNGHVLKVHDKFAGNLKVQHFLDVDFANEFECDGAEECVDKHDRSLLAVRKKSFQRSVVSVFDIDIETIPTLVVGTLDRDNLHNKTSGAAGPGSTKKRSQKHLEELLELADHMSIRVMHSGVGWHSSGSYLLRTPLNALLSGIADFFLGFGFSFLGLLVILRYPTTSQMLYQRLKQCFWSLPGIANCYQFSYSRQSSTTGIVSPPPSSRSLCRVMQKCCDCALKLSPIFVLWTVVKMSVIGSSLTLFYIQNSQFWVSPPLLPFKSLFSLAVNAFSSYAFWVGVIVQWQVATLAFAVLPMLIFGTTSPEKDVASSLDEDNDKFSDSTSSLSFPQRGVHSENIFRSRHSASPPIGPTPELGSPHSKSKSRSKNIKCKSQSGWKSMAMEYWKRIVGLFTQQSQSIVMEHIPQKKNNVSEQTRTVVSLIYMIIITFTLLGSSIFSFLWMPEFHTTSLMCDHYDAMATVSKSTHGSSFQEILLNDAVSKSNMRGKVFMSTDKYESLYAKSRNTGKIRDSIVLTDVHDADDQLDSDHIMSEIVAAPCSGLLVRIRKRSSDSMTTSQAEIDVLTRIEKYGHDFFLRLDMSHFDKLYDKSLQSKRKDESSSIRIFVTETFDGWWKSYREYDFGSPLSANYQPVSESITVFAGRQRIKDGKQYPYNVIKKPDFTLSLLPSHPVGIVLFKTFMEVNLHRRLAADDEKGLSEALNDKSRSLTSLTLKYNNHKFPSASLNESKSWNAHRVTPQAVVVAPTEYQLATSERLQEIRLGLYSLKIYLLDSMQQLLSMENNEKSDALLIKSLSLLPGGGGGHHSVCAHVELPRKYWNAVHALHKFTYNHHISSSEGSSSDSSLKKHLSFSKLSIGCTLDCLSCISDQRNNDISDKGMGKEDVIKGLTATGGLLGIRMTTV